MKTCLILTGGSLDLAFAGSFLEHKKYDVVIAVDAGLAVAEKLGIVPDTVVGDFDTVEYGVLERYKRKSGIVWDEHKPEKNETDTELAINMAASMECGELTILGATGGRLDHAIGNIHLLYTCLLRGMTAQIVDKKNKIYILDRGKSFDRSQLWGKYISFLPLTEEVRGITLEGFKYPLNQKDIAIGTGSGLCISNELAGEEGRIEFSGGVLICIESHD